MSKETAQIASRLLSQVSAGDAVMFCGIDDNRGLGVCLRSVATAMSSLGNQRVLIVDFQTGDRSVSGAVGGSGVSGVSDLLIGNTDLATAIQWHRDEAVGILPAGREDHLLADTALLPGSAMGLIESLKDKSDLTLIFGPPFRLSINSDRMARATDGVVLGVKARRNKRPEIADVMDGLEQLEVPLLGAVLIERR